MKKWQVFTASVMSLVLAVSIPLTAFAQQAGETTPARTPKGSLAIVAPRQVPAGKEMSLGVFQRENQDTVPGAGVWALTRENAEAIKNDTTFRDRIANAEDTDYESILGGRGSFLGRTGGDGRLHHTFTEAGSYVLVAAKKGYVPDFSPLIVKGLPVGALVVSAPRVSPPGESVTIKVTERLGGDAVKDAGIWALTRENAEAVKSQITSARATENSSIDADSVLNTHGTFLGRTNGNGELKHTFEATGTVVLAAYKKGYAPGFSVIAIKDIPQALAIHAPKTAPAGESVTFKVTQRGTDDPVKDAGVWALTPTEAEALKAGNTVNATNIASIESVIEGRGIFIGKTNGNGEVKYKFETAARYVIVTTKNSYIPAYTGIAIVSPNAKPSGKPAVAAGVKPNNGRSNNTTAGRQ